MDGKDFDTLARGLGQEPSRRRVLGGVFGGALALLTGSSALANRGKTRRGKHRRREGDEPFGMEGVLPEGVLAGGIWDETLDMCHYDPATGGYRIVPVSTVAVPEYLARGDTLFIDCCVDTDCGWRMCLTATGCIEGACAYDATVNAPCDLGNGVTGICRSDAVCVASTPEPVVGVA